jgi:hypothetical protein
MKYYKRNPFTSPFKSSLFQSRLEVPAETVGPATSLETPMTEHFLGPMRRNPYRCNRCGYRLNPELPALPGEIGPPLLPGKVISSELESAKEAKEILQRLEGIEDRPKLVPRRRPRRRPLYKARRRHRRRKRLTPKRSAPRFTPRKFWSRYHSHREAQFTGPGGTFKAKGFQENGRKEFVSYKLINGRWVEKDCYSTWNAAISDIQGLSDAQYLSI